MNYEYLTIEDAERLAKNKIDEEIAVEYLNSLDKRAFMTMNEVDLANLVIKYKNELSKEKEKNKKAIEWINSHIETYTKNGISIIDWNTTSDPRQLKKILRGEDNETN